MRKPPNESDGIRNQDRQLFAELNTADQRVEGRKQPARHQRVFLREGSKQRGLASVGIADQRNQRQLIPPAALPMELAMFADLLDVALERADAMPDLAAVHFQFG